MTSGQDPTIVCFPVRRNASPPAGSVRASTAVSISGNLTRADIAAFTAAQIDDDRYVRAAKAVSA
jgi:hypothetical protein